MSMRYTFRRLNATDIFAMCRVLQKIGAREILHCLNSDSMKVLFSGAKDSTDDNFINLGLSAASELVDILLVNLPTCENEIYQMLSQASDLTVEQVKNMEFADFIGMVIAFIKKEEFRDFLSVAFKSFK